MIGRLSLLILALVAGVAVASLIPGFSQSVRKAVGLMSEPGATQSRGEGASRAEQRKPATEPTDEKQNIIKLTEEQIIAARIDLVAIQGGTLSRRLIVPGTIVPHADRIARVTVKLSGTVAELRKRLGETVEQNEIMAVIESREVADAKSEYLAAKTTDDLRQTLFVRAKMLWEGKVVTENDFLRARAAAEEARIKMEVARQKLSALGLSEEQIAALPEQPVGSLPRQQLRAPIKGRVVERKVDLGTAVGRDNLETELFVIVDLDRVWVELAVSPADLPVVKEGQSVSITIRGIPEKGDGAIVFISPLMDKETRAARIVAEIDNSSGGWRPGSFITASITVEQQSVPLAVPTGAVQTISKQKVVFVRAPEGFE